MRTRQREKMPASLSRLRQRFVTWRKRRVSRERIPESLWSSAVEMAAEHGLNRTARFLKLDYYSLKKRVDDASGVTESSAFVELPSSPLSNPSECVVELEDPSGARMRVHVKGQDLPDVLALSRSFWNAD